jgi:hypothetical protein
MDGIIIGGGDIIPDIITGVGDVMLAIGVKPNAAVV